MNGSPSGSPLWSYETLRSSLELDEKGFFAVFHDFRLDSHFQPIVSLTHARVIGHEGLIRPTLLASSEQRPIPPHLLLHRVEDDLDQLIELDRLCRLLHIANAGDAKQGWLFLNIHPRVFVAPQRGDIRSFTTLACNDFGLKREHVVLELLEHALIDETEFADAIRNMRENGYLVALDDFGAGHSNFDRVWKISPEIVKLDRVFAIGAESDPRIRRLLPRIVALLHEAGVFVLLEGIETYI